MKPKSLSIIIIAIERILKKTIYIIDQTLKITKGTNNTKKLKKIYKKLKVKGGGRVNSKVVKVTGENVCSCGIW